MFARVIILVGALAWSLLPVSSVALGAMGLAAVVAGVVTLLRPGAGRIDQGGELPLKNPFRLLSAIKFAALFAAVLLLSRLTQRYLPEAGLYWVSAIAGSTDVDAVALSLLDLAGTTTVSPELVARGLVIAAMANTLVKLGLIGFLGNRRLAWRLAEAHRWMSWRQARRRWCSSERGSVRGVKVEDAALAAPRTAAG